jgi:tripartite-type tricarboxylate transporter receptor subunit TctC
VKRVRAASLTALLLAAAGCARGAAVPSEAPAAARPAATTSASSERAVADFYRGKTVRIIVCCTAGGSYDVIARMVARHIRQYIPGTPNVVVENRPGAGGILSANTVYGSEAKDGTVIGLLSENMVLLDAVGTDGVQFQAERFNWLGSTNRSPYGCMVRTDLGISSIQQVIGGRQVAVAAPAPGNALHDTAAIMNGALGTSFQIVAGYGGGADTRLAMERGEADGICSNLESMLTIDRPRLQGDNPSARVLVMMGDKVPDYPFLAGVPAAQSLARTDEDKRLLEAVNAPSLMGRPFVMAPQVPGDRVEALRQALAEALADPKLRSEAEQAGFNLSPSSGDEIARIVRSVKSMPPETLATIKEVLHY